MNYKFTLSAFKAILFLSLTCLFSCREGNPGSTEGETPEGSASATTEGIEVLERYIAIDNVCAWPNITRLPDGTFIATIFNQPSHARREGDVECWASPDGKFWSKRGTPAPHDPMTNRMNVAAGLAGNGDLIVIASGWVLKAGDKPDEGLSLVSVQRPWVSRSKDGGKTWTIGRDAFPGAETGMTNYIPFGDILQGADEHLRVLAYNQSDDKKINTLSIFRSADDGRTWSWQARISDAKDDTAFSEGHNETAFFHTGDGKWIAAARRWKGGQAMDLFSSEDDGNTWKLNGPLTGENQHPGHVTALKNGDLLLSYGNRQNDRYGVAVKISRDKGKTWGDEQLVIADLSSRDCGYPASIELEDGNILTLYYANGTTAHQRYHMGSIIWKLR